MKFQRITHFSLETLLGLQKNLKPNHIWRMVVAATCWSIWLARNEWIFQQTRVDKRSLEFLIFARVNKWGQAMKLLNFSNDPLWRTNPQGAIATYYHSLSVNYWATRRNAYDYVCAVDGAWGSTSSIGIKGGIGGNITDKNGRVVYVFSGPVWLKSSLETEIEAIRHMVNIIGMPRFSNSKVVICSDSIQAINIVREGSLNNVKIKVGILNIDTMMHRYILNYVPRELNETADSLARAGQFKDSTSTYWA